MAEGGEDKDGENRWYRLGRRFAWLIDRNWVSIVAIAGCAAVFLFIADHGRREVEALERQYTEGYQRSTAYEASKFGGKLAVECREPAIGELFDCDIGTEKPEQPDYTAQQDLLAQQEMAVRTNGLFWIGILGLIASVIGVGFVYANLVATRSIGENQNKAYVFATGARIHVGSGKGVFGALLGHTILVNIKNSGLTPATELDGFARLEVKGSKSDIPLTLDVGDFANVITPGEDGALRFTIPIGAMEPADLDEKGVPNPEDFTAVTWKGTIYYTDVFGSRYRTDFHFTYSGWPSVGDHMMLPAKGRLVMFKRISDWRRRWFYARDRKAKA